MTRAKPITVLIVDDSAVVRETLTAVLSSDPAIEVIGTAPDPFVAAMKMLEQAPDVILLDIQMPRMDGLTFLRKIMSQHPIPVVICSALTEQGADETMRALQYGAVDIVNKPKVGAKHFLEESQIRLCDAVKAASQAKLRPPGRAVARLKVEPKLSADAMLDPPISGHQPVDTATLIAIGASTGGTDAVSAILQSLPASAPGVVIVQHMPERFTTAFAKRLDDTCEMMVKEAADGDLVAPGHAFVAPGNKHMLIKRAGDRYRIEVADGPLVSRHRPSVDVLFRSAAIAAGANGISVLLTGMGDDGSHGMLEMHEAGAYTIAQDEASSVVWGMPAEAVRLGAADTVLPLERISGALLERAAKSRHHS